MQDISNLITIMFRKCYVFIPLNIEWISITYLAPENTIHKYISNVFFSLFFMYLTDEKNIFVDQEKKMMKYRVQVPKSFGDFVWGSIEEWFDQIIVNTLEMSENFVHQKMPQYLS